MSDRMNKEEPLFIPTDRYTLRLEHTRNYGKGNIIQVEEPLEQMLICFTKTIVASDEYTVDTLSFMLHKLADSIIDEALRRAKA